jgi:hypothetical protein
MKKLTIAALAAFSLSAFASASAPAPAGSTTAKVEAKKAEKPASAKK